MAIAAGVCVVFLQVLVSAFTTHNGNANGNDFWLEANENGWDEMAGGCTIARPNVLFAQRQNATALHY